MGAVMEMIGGKQDDAALRQQEALAKQKERQQAQEMRNRRRAIGGQSKTIFSAVEGIGATTKKKTTLGG